jgi:hypothetical protein
MIRKLVVLVAGVLLVGLLATGCEQTRQNISELGDYFRGIALDGTDIHSFAR